MYLYRIFKTSIILLKTFLPQLFVFHSGQLSIRLLLKNFCLFDGCIVTSITLFFLDKVPSRIFSRCFVSKCFNITCKKTFPKLPNPLLCLPKESGNYTIVHNIYRLSFYVLCHVGCNQPGVLGDL